MTWPQGVTDQTPLPFSIWRILDALASSALSSLHSAPGGAPDEAQVRTAIALAEQYATRAQRGDQIVDEGTLREVVGALVASIGPMGEVIVEDAMDELPEPVRLSMLLRALGQELQDAQRQTFGRQLRTRGLL